MSETSVLHHHMQTSLPRWRKRIGIFAFGVLALLAWQGGRLVLLDYRAATLAFASVPSWACELILPFGFGVMSLRFLSSGLSAILKRERP